MINPMPKVIISASGMATGGRVLHHLKSYAPDATNTILFAGYQAGGSRGAAMVGGADTVKIHGEYVPVRAEVKNLEMLSADADADEILRWLKGFNTPLRTHSSLTVSRAPPMRCAAGSRRNWVGRVSCQITYHERCSTRRSGPGGRASFACKTSWRRYPIRSRGVHAQGLPDLPFGKLHRT